MKITRELLIATALVVVVHVAGIAIGVALSRTVGAHPPPPLPPLERIVSELRLDVEQAASVRATLDTLRTTIDGLRAEIDPQIASALDDATTEIRAVLRDDQRALFDRWRTDRPPHGPPPHGPPPHGPPPHGPPPHGPPPHGPPPPGFDPLRPPPPGAPGFDLREAPPRPDTPPLP
jgi:hypothetical protein